MQTSAALKDTLFEKMSFDDWEVAIRPKVEASCNFHTGLPKGLDCFIMTSSASGILEKVTQSDYAASNTFQDSLAQHRVSRGE